jgi:hypothetical protein
MSRVYQIFSKDLKLPKMTASLKDFFEYLVFRQCDSLIDMRFSLFLEILDENYLIEESPYEDPSDEAFHAKSVSRESSLKQSSNIEPHNNLQ